MAKAKVGAAGIEYIQGALKRPKKQDGHRHGNYLVLTHRTAPSQNPDCQRIYSFGAERYDRTSQPSTKELKARERFAGVAAMVTARRADLTKIVADQQAFLAQKDTAGGAKTMRAYLWRVCGQEYDQQHG